MSFAPPHRPSILQRPVRAEAKANVENLDSEFQKEQQRFAAKAGRLASTEERLIRSFYGTEAEKRSGWETTQQELQELERSRAAAAAEERQREEAWLAQPQQVYVDTSRPWTAGSSTYFILREQEEEARRRAQREDAEANRLLMYSKQFQQQQERQLEREAIRSTMQSEDAWFNRGAASERWIPPERRIKQRAVVPPQFAPAPPPYHCDAPTARPSTAPAAGAGAAVPKQPPGRRSAFWERESGQGAKSALCHNVYFQGDQAAARRAGAQQAQQRQLAPSPAPSVRSQSSMASPAPSVRGQAVQRPAPQQRYPWSWDT